MRMRYLKRTASLIAVAVALCAAAFLRLFLPGGDEAFASHYCSATGSLSGPFDMESYEAADYREAYAHTFELAAFNSLFPEHAGFATQDVETGGRASGSTQTVDGYIPPVILKSVGFIESGWAQASYDPLVQYGEIGPALTSHDCGYGIMQITSGMQNISGVPNLDQTMIGSHFGFNIARGAAILTDKWNAAPEFRPIVGVRNPALIEDWYFAIWGYNGWAFSNHPLNPAYQPTRVPFSCGASGDGYGHDRSQYPYQELIFGCAERPPVRAGQQLWPPQAIHLPDLSDPAFAGPLKLENWNPCAYSLDCAAMDIPTPNANHQDPTPLDVTREEVIGEPIMGLSSGGISLSLAPGAVSELSFGVQNDGTGVLSFRALSNSSWLRPAGPVGVALGDDLGPVAATVDLTVDTAGLAPGGHIGRVTLDSLYADSSPKSFLVALTVTENGATQTPGPQPTPSALAAEWGDADCSGAVNSVDSLLTMRHDAGLGGQASDCPGIGETVQLVDGPPVVWGDVDCSGGINAIDAVKILTFDAGLNPSLVAGCPAIGAQVLIASG